MNFSGENGGLHAREAFCIYNGATHKFTDLAINWF